MESYPFASQIDGIVPEAMGAMIVENHRFYPLATTYFVVEHPGGTCNFVYEGDEQDVVFSLHATNEQGQTLEAEQVWTIGEHPVHSLELPQGEYWLLGTLPIWKENSQKIEFCFGADCEIPSNDEVEEEIEKGGCSVAPVGSFSWLLPLFVLLRRKKKIW